MLNMDELHFVSYKKKAQFKLKANIGPYIFNTRAATKEVEAILSQSDLSLVSLGLMTLSESSQNLDWNKRVLHMHIHQGHKLNSMITKRNGQRLIYKKMKNNWLVSHPYKHLFLRRRRPKGGEDMSPTDSETQGEEFIVFKRKNKDLISTKKSDPQVHPLVITIQDESPEEIYTQHSTTVVLTGTHVNYFPQAEETIQSPNIESTVQSPVYSSSLISTQQSIFSR